MSETEFVVWIDDGSGEATVIKEGAAKEEMHWHAITATKKTCNITSLSTTGTNIQHFFFLSSSKKFLKCL